MARTHSRSRDFELATLVEPATPELAWEFSSDEALESFTLNRRRGQSSAMIAAGDARTTHSYTGASVEPGETYQYELVIRTASGDEFISPTSDGDDAACGHHTRTKLPQSVQPDDDNCILHRQEV